MGWQQARDDIITRMENNNRFETTDPDGNTVTVDSQPTEMSMGWIAEEILEEVPTEFPRHARLVANQTFGNSGPVPIDLSGPTILDDSSYYNFISPDTIEVAEDGFYVIRLNLSLLGGDPSSLTAFILRAELPIASVTIPGSTFYSSVGAGKSVHVSPSVIAEFNAGQNIQFTLERTTPINANLEVPQDSSIFSLTKIR